MSKACTQGSTTTAASTAWFPTNLTPFFCLFLATMFMVVAAGRAEEPDDQYLHILNLIQQGEAYAKDGQDAKAMAKFQEARKGLQNFQKSYPAWNVKTVSYRLDYVGKKLAALEDKAAPGGTGTTSTPSSQTRLVAAGSEPRKALRLHPQPGDKQTLEITQKNTVDTKVGEMQNAVKMPAMTMAMDMTVKSVSPGGDILCDLVMQDATVSAEPETVPQLVDAMKAVMGGLKGLQGTGTISSRGFSKGVEFKAPAGANPQTKQTVDQLKESMAGVVVPLPEEAVGPGAKWEVKTVIKSQGMTIEQTSTYELVSVDGERIALKTTISQQAPAQKIQNTAMPAIKMDLTKMTGDGTGELTCDLTKVLPADATLDSRSDMTMNMEAGGQKQTIVTKMQANLRLESK